MVRRLSDPHVDVELVVTSGSQSRLGQTSDHRRDIESGKEVACVEDDVAVIRAEDTNRALADPGDLLRAIVDAPHGQATAEEKLRDEKQSLLESQMRHYARDSNLTIILRRRAKGQRHRGRLQSGNERRGDGAAASRRPSPALSNSK